ncbi:MAG: hypothetical protein R8L53_05040 [Mariprofundales bacterium]
MTIPKKVGIKFVSKEAICQIVNGESTLLWENKWIASNALKDVLDVGKIVQTELAEDINEVIQPEEVELFKQNAWAY